MSEAVGSTIVRQDGDGKPVLGSYKLQGCLADALSSEERQGLLHGARLSILTEHAYVLTYGLTAIAGLLLSRIDVWRSECMCAP